VSSDPFVDEMRKRISALDRELFETVNRRIDLVAELKRYKERAGIGFVDPGREAQMVAEQLAANTGPLSEQGLRTLYAELLALTKREVG
jgi:chorismate mutase/prephenate dehydratase